MNKIKWNKETKSFSEEVKEFAQKGPWYVVREFNPIGPGGYTVMSKERINHLLDEFDEDRAKNSIIYRRKYERYQNPIAGPYENKQEATDEKIRLQIKDYGKKAMLSEKQKKRAIELGLLK